MTILVKPLADGVGTGALATVYTCPINTAAVIKKWSFNNTTAGALLITAVINNGTADRELLSAVSLAAKTPYNPSEINGATLSAGWTVKLNIPAGITFLLSGIEVI